jgi:ribosomal protein L29
MGMTDEQIQNLMRELGQIDVKLEHVVKTLDELPSRISILEKRVARLQTIATITTGGIAWLITFFHDKILEFLKI